MKIFAWVMALALALSLNACSLLNPTAKDQLGTTTASYKAGEVALDYTSNKNQENFKTDIGIDPKTGKLVTLHAETTAVTPESAIAATAQAQAAALAALSKMIDQLSVLIPQAARAGALAGS